MNLTEEQHKKTSHFFPSAGIDTTDAGIMPDAFEEWLAEGISRGWVYAPFCYAHDVPALNEQQVATLHNGGEACIPLLQITRNVGKCSP